MNEPSWLRRVIRRFRNIDNPIPEPEQPLPNLEFPELDDELLADAWAENRRLRHGPAPVFTIELTNTLRHMEYVGHEAWQVSVPENKHLRFEAIIIGPDGKKYEVAGSFKSGENWSKQRQREKLASSIKFANHTIEEPSMFIMDSVVKINWYLTSYEPLGK